MPYEPQCGDIAMALTGESLITRKLSCFREPLFLKLREMLQPADVAFTNAGCLFQEYEECPNTFPGLARRASSITCRSCLSRSAPRSGSGGALG